MTRQVKRQFGLGRLRHALGEGVSEDGARNVYRLLAEHGLLGETAGVIDPSRLVGLAEFAEIMNRTVQAVRSWQALPEPLVRLKAGPIWDRLHAERFRDAHPELCGARVTPPAEAVQ